MQNFLTRLTKTKYVPFAILVFLIASFGILIPSLGYYWDDWPMIWLGHLTGTSGYIDALAGDRPFLAGIYLLTTSLLGLSAYLLAYPCFTQPMVDSHHLVVGAKKTMA